MLRSQPDSISETGTEYFWFSAEEIKEIIEVLESKEETKPCPHKNITTWNQGYNSLCKDCGKRDIY